MQNRKDFGTPRFGTPQPNMDVFSDDIAKKVPKCTNYGWKVCNFFKFPIFKIFLPLYELTSENKVIKCRNHNIAFLLNVLAITVCKCWKNIGQKLIFSSYFEYISCILTQPFLPLYVLTSKVAVLKYRHSISVKFSGTLGLPTYPYITDLCLYG